MPAREDFMSQLQQILQNKDITTPLLAAAGTGLVGGTLAARSPKRRGESQEERRKRILRDAVLSAGAGGLGTAALRYGYGSLQNALPAGSENPAAKGLGLLGRVAGGGAVGGGTYWAAKNRWNARAMDTIEGASEAIRAGAPKNTSEARLRLKSMVERLSMNENPTKALSEAFPDKGLPKLLERSNIRMPGSGPTGWEAFKSSLTGAYGKSKDVINTVGNQPIKQTLTSVRGRVAPDGARAAARSLPGKAEKQVLERLVPFARRHPGLSAGLATAVAAPTALHMGGELLGLGTPNFLNYQD